MTPSPARAALLALLASGVPAPALADVCASLSECGGGTEGGARLLLVAAGCLVGLVVGLAARPGD